jgi:hypothetical protein
MQSSVVDDPALRGRFDLFNDGSAAVCSKPDASENILTQDVLSQCNRVNKHYSDQKAVN